MNVSPTSASSFSKCFINSLLVLSERRVEEEDNLDHSREKKDHLPT